MHLIIFVWITVSVAAFAGVQEVKANGFSSDLPPCSEAAAPLCPVANSGNVVTSQYWQWHWGVTHGTPYSLTADGASSPETSRNSMVHEPLSSSEKINAARKAQCIAPNVSVSLSEITLINNQASPYFNGGGHNKRSHAAQYIAPYDTTVNQRKSP